MNILWIYELFQKGSCLLAKEQHSTIWGCIFFHVLLTKKNYHEYFQIYAHFFNINNVMRENTILACNYPCYLNPLM
jgi:hypothetical protein